MVKLFTEHRGSLPKLVIITRDGVSEGQIKMVRTILYRGGDGVNNLTYILGSLDGCF